MSKTKKTCVSILCAVFAVLCAATLTAAFGFTANASVEVTTQRSYSGFDGFEVVQNDGAATVGNGTVAFTECLGDKTKIAAYKKKLTGQYSVEFYLGGCTAAGGRAFLHMSFGADTPDAYDDSAVYGGFIARGVINSAGTYSLNTSDPAHSDIGPWSLDKFYKFTVNSEGNIWIYSETVPITSEHQPRGTIVVADNADFSKTDGYFMFANGLHDSDNNAPVSVSVANVKANGTDIVTAADWNTLGTSGAASDTVAVTSSAFAFNDVAFGSNNPILKSEFEIKNEGVADGDILFESSFKIWSSRGRTTAHFGLYFGLDDSENVIDDTFGAVDFMGATFSAGGQTDTACKYICESDTLDVHITAYGNGRLVAEYACPEPTCAKDNKKHTIDTTVAKDYFDGKMAFGVLPLAEDGSSPSIKVWDIAFTGNVKTEAESVFTFEQENALRMDKGSSVTLSGSYATDPASGVSSAVTFSIVSGSESVTLSGNTLTAVELGHFTVRMTAANGEYKDYNGEVIGGRYNVNIVDETFGNGLDTSVWRKVLPGSGDIKFGSENIWAENGATFESAATTGGVDPKVVLRGAKFAKVNESDNVFDIKFTAAVAPAGMNDYGVGFMFGMPNENANFASVGVGAVRVSSTQVYVYKGGQKQEPTYLKPKESDSDLSYGTENSQSYTSNAPVTVRIIGKKDGTLELYRQQYFDNFGPQDDRVLDTKIDVLYATYTGFDFEGYVAMYGTGTATATGIVKDVTVKGTALYGSPVIGISVETDLTDLRVGMKDIGLSANVSFIPGEGVTGEWGVSVTDGADVAEITGDKKLHVIKAGTATLRFASTEDANVYEDVVITVGEPIGYIDFDSNVLGGLIIGDEVVLNAKYLTDPATDRNSAVTYTLVSADGAATLDGNKITTVKAGTATLTVTSQYDPSVTEDFSFSVAALKRQDFSITDTFSELAEEDWFVKEYSTGAITTNGGLCFTGAVHDETTHDVPRAALMIPFSPNPKTGVAFDVMFTARPGDRAGANFGFMFGLNDSEDTLYRAGVGSIRFTNSWMEIMNAGTVIQPDELYYDGRQGFAYMSEHAMTVRLVGKNDGTLEVYLGMSYDSYNVSIDDLYAVYTGFDTEGYAAFYADMQQGQTAYVRDFSAKGTLLYDPENVEITRIEANESALTDLYYTPAPIELGIKVYAKPNLDIFKGYSVSVTKGNATFENGKLTLSGAGDYTVAVTSEQDPTVKKEISFKANVLEIESITIDTKGFENVTTDTQPINLVATVKANTYLQKYLNVEFEVLEGNAEIAGKQLRVKGAGKVVIKATSTSLPDKSVTYEFNVRDADTQYDINGAFDAAGNKKGCKKPSYELIGFTLLLVGFAACKKFA